MAEGYIFEAKDINGKFLAYFIANESSRAEAESLVRKVSLAESVNLVKELDAHEISNWQLHLRIHARTASFELAKGTCLDLATWVHT